MIAGKQANRGLVARIGPLDVDIPRSIGYFGGIGLAVAFEVIEWPVGLFIASIPLVKMLNRPKLPEPVRFVEHVLDGMAKPVGGDSEGTVRAASEGSSAEESLSTGSVDANAGTQSPSPNQAGRRSRATTTPRRGTPSRSNQRTKRVRAAKQR